MLRIAKQTGLSLADFKYHKTQNIKHEIGDELAPCYMFHVS